VPFDWESDRRSADNAEVKPIVGVLPDVLAVQDQELAESLLKTGVEFVAVTWAKRSEIAWHAGRGNDGNNDRVIAPRARNHEVFVKRGFQDAGVGNAQDRIRRPAKNGPKSRPGYSDVGCRDLQGRVAALRAIAVWVPRCLG
jgi:hypothetical protein